ncbi:MAG TPA: exodeoxyribonuclease III [Clostridiales bacterium]|nr:exodeoxyribonuclease III [Clostridiales bacterium]
MKLISWNVNGFRAVLQKGFNDFFTDENADIFCIQETKMQEGQADFSPQGYYCYYHSAVRKGYSGTAVFTKVKPKSVSYGIDDNHNDEGRAITLEFDNFFLVNCYTPNSKMELLRIDYRMEFEDAMRSYLSRLKKKKPVIYCGDLNVAHEEIDLKNPKPNKGNAGFSDEERGKITELLDAGFVDSYRYLFPDVIGAYTWWSYRFNARKNNAGWRIDYFIVSDDVKNSIQNASIYSKVLGSDHCPIGLEINI